MPKFGRLAWILIALMASIVVGLFFGESCSILQPFSQAFVKILQITVLPFIVVNLVVGIGSMRSSEARIVAIKGCTIMVFFWILGAVTVFSMQLAFPRLSKSSFFSNNGGSNAIQFNPLEVFIPYNPFHSLAEGLLPSIVLFCLLLGFAMIGIKRKKILMSSLEILSLGLAQVSRFIQAIVPLGIFIVAANTAGTMTVHKLLELQVFLVTSVCFCLLLALFALPLLVSSITPFRFRDLLYTASGAVILGATAANDFITLPLIAEGVQSLFRKRELDEEQLHEIKTYCEVLPPMVFSFPLLGNFMAIFFVLFVAWFYMNPLHTTDCLKLLLAGIPSIFGPATISIPFLLNIMHLPADAIELYLSARPIQIHFLIGLMVMSLFSFTAICVASLMNQARIKWMRLSLSILLIAVVFAATITGLHSGFAVMLNSSSESAQMVRGMSLQDANGIWLGDSPLEMVVYRDPDKLPLPGAQESEDVLERIRGRDTLRVGYGNNTPAFSFFNQSGNLVGYDVQMAQDLARFLGVSKIEFVPIEYNSIAGSLNRGYCDIVMSAVSVTPQRLKEMDFTKPYMELNPAFVTHDWRTGEFKIMDEVQARTDLSIAVLNGTEDVKIAEALFPNATLIKLASFDEFFQGDRGDALFDNAEIGSFLTLLHPYYAVVIPSLTADDYNVSDSYAYPIARSSNRTLLNLLDYWLVLEDARGDLDYKYNYWILGKNAEKTSHRWCIARDVLHWDLGYI